MRQINIHARHLCEASACLAAIESDLSRQTEVRCHMSDSDCWYYSFMFCSIVLPPHYRLPYKKTPVLDHGTIASWAIMRWVQIRVCTDRLEVTPRKRSDHPKETLSGWWSCMIPSTYRKAQSHHHQRHKNRVPHAAIE